jgi:ribose transport system ATP-binding protein
MSGEREVEEATVADGDDVLELTSVRKRYGRTEALKGVHLRVAAGEIHGLLGKNGAGKSTLIKVISGAVTPDEGTVKVRGIPVDLGSPAAARARGVAVVHQELSLVESMTVAENLQLGCWPGRAGLVDRAQLREQALAAMRRVGLQRDPDERLGNLGMAERQLVEIAKALASDVRVLLLDEPTSSLSETEAERLFRLMHELKVTGVGIIYVSHRLSEVLAHTDRISILRDGLVEPPLLSAEATEMTLARLMVGEVREVEVGHETLERLGVGDALLQVSGLCVDQRLKDVSFEARRGELVAVYGLMGAGRSRLARALFGLERWSAGSASLDGEAYAPGSTGDAIRQGVGFVGEDRAAGLVPKMSVAENIVLGALDRFRKRGQLDRKAVDAAAAELVQRLRIKTQSLHAPVSSLSGGNQQKVLLARWLCVGAHLLVLDDPARGVDVSAKEEIFGELATLTDAGTTVLYFTSDAAEARRLGDRVLVMASGRIVAELDPSIDEDSIVATAGGARV